MFKYDESERAWIDQDTGDRIEPGNWHWHMEEYSISLVAADGTRLGGIEYKSNLFNDEDPKCGSANNAIYTITRARKFNTELKQPRLVELKRGSDPVLDRLIEYLQHHRNARFPGMKVQVIDARIPGST